MRQRLAEGAIGELQCIKTCSRDAPFPPKEYLRISGRNSQYFVPKMCDLNVPCGLLNQCYCIQSV